MKDLRQLLTELQRFEYSFIQIGVVFSLTESNVTLVPPTPNPPLLLSSEYFGFALQWTEYSLRYNDSPIIFVLEVKRHENVPDPATFLPVIKKYHTVRICQLQYRGTTEKSFIRGASPRSNPIHFYISFLTEMVPQCVSAIDKWYSFNIPS